MPKRLIGRWCVWNKVFDKKFFKKYNIRFYDFGYQGEDTAVSTLCYVKAKKVYCVDTPLHYHVIRKNSLQHSMDKSGLENLLRVYKKLYSDLIKQNAPKLFIGLTKNMIEQKYKELKTYTAV